VKRATALAFAVFLSAYPPIRLSAQTRFELPDSLIAALRSTVDNGLAPGIVMGVVDPDGARFFSFGVTAQGGSERVTERTIFEIGSITKVFTSLVLADMAIRGEVALDDPVTRLLGGARVPGGDSITLRLLATHHSGLPRLPGNLAPADPANPYADYDGARLLSFLASHALRRAPGERYEYSNLGAGLLGYALARRDGGSYEAMVQRRVIAPLRLSSTMINVTPGARERLAQGSSDGRPASGWDFDALAGAGALRSSAEDMTRFLAAAIGLLSTPLDSAFRMAATPLLQAGGPAMRVGLGWHIRTASGVRIIWHDGGTGGYRSWAGYDPDRRAAVVVLANSGANVDQLGFHALDHSVPLPVVRPAIAIAPESLDAYVGVYTLAPGITITISRSGDMLLGQVTGQNSVRLYASARDEFFLRVVEASISFQRGADGRVNGLVLHQNGRDVPARRQP